MFATSKTQWRRPLVTIPITFSRHTRPARSSPFLFFFLFFFYEPTLSYDFGDPIDRPTVAGADGEDIACLLASEKGLILGIPCEDSTGRVTRSEIAVTITGFREHEGGRSPPDRTSLSRTRRTGCCIPEVILRSKRRVSGRRARREEKESSGRRRRESEEKAP